MKSRIVRIGNYREIRIPEVLLERTGLGEKVDIEVQGERLVIRPIARPRAGWRRLFQKMAEADDTLLDAAAHIPTFWEGGEWEW